MLERHVHLLDLCGVLVGLVDQRLELRHVHILLVRLFSGAHQLVEFRLLRGPEVGDVLVVALKPAGVVLPEDGTLVEDHGILIVLRCLLLVCALVGPALSLQAQLDLLCILTTLLSFINAFLHRCLILDIILIELLHLSSNRVDLGVQDELLTKNVKSRLLQLLFFLFKVLAHLHVLSLKKQNVLVRSLLIIEQGSNTGLLLVLNYLFFQDFELQFHEMDLLLKVGNVFILNRGIRILTECCLSVFVLTAELHGIGRFVVWVVE
jgi:hypothetical protein